MEDVFGSLRCPYCRHGLFTAAFFNLTFFSKSHCPYCGTALRWAPRPFAYLLVGTVMAGSGAYFVTNKAVLPASFEHAPVAAIALGIGICIVSLLAMHFQVVEEPLRTAPARTRLSYRPGS